MIIYNHDINTFLKHAKDPNLLVALVKRNLLEKFGIKVAESERKSWRNSLPQIAKLIKENGRDKRKVLIEFNIPTSKKRIDFIILGKNKKGKPSAVIIELKQWSDVLEESWNNFRVGRYHDSHPSYQVADYKLRLDHELGLENKVDILAAAYLHNLKNSDSPLLAEKYEPITDQAKMYYAINEYELEQDIDVHTYIRNGSKAFEYFRDSKWAPTKKFKDMISEDFLSINLVGSQKLIYESIVRFIKAWNKKDKMTFIISGDPGSGKTMIAFKLLNHIVAKLGIKMQMMLPGQEVRAAFKDNVYNKILSENITGSVVRNGYDCAIIDEAHKAVGRDIGRVNYNKMLKKLNFVVVLIDDYQVINKKGITKGEVIKIAKENGHRIYEYNIDENFRNLGERVMIDWISSTFYDEDVVSGDHKYRQETYVNKSQRYKLHTYNSAKCFTDKYFKIYSKNKKNVRIASLWTSEFHSGPADENGLPKATLFIGDEGFIWNPNAQFWSTVEDRNKVTFNAWVKRFANDRKQYLISEPHERFIAYFNHIQGFEFEEIFVYIPDVFYMEDGIIKFEREKLAKEVKHSQTWAPSNKDFTKEEIYKKNMRYFLNRIKVMLTRGTKATHVFAEDKELNDYIKNKVV